MTIAGLASPLRPLVLLLSSDKPGEITAAAAQITRRLNRARLDWHHLTDALAAGPVPNINEVRRPPAGSETSWFEALDSFASAAADDFSDRDREFIASMQAIIARGFTPTEKQSGWLRGLFQRAGGQFAEEEEA